MLTHKKGRRGRPPKSARQSRVDEVQRKSDGDRLQRALSDLGLSQAECAERTGIRQGWISEIVNGNRAIGREDLRRLGKAGISADFVLGLTDTLIPPTQSRAMSRLESDLAAAIERELDHRYPPIVSNSQQEYLWKVAGDFALKTAIDTLASQAEQELATVVEVRQLESETKSLQHAVSILHDKAIHSQPASAARSDLIDAASDVLKVAEKHYARITERLKTENRGRGVLLIESERWERYVRTREGEVE